MNVIRFAAAAAVAFPINAWSHAGPIETAPALRQALEFSGTRELPAAPLIPAAAAKTEAPKPDWTKETPIPTEAYYRTRTTFTFYVVESTTRKKRPKIGPIVRTGLTAKFGDGPTSYQFTFTKLYTDTPSVVLTLSEYMRTPGASPDEFKEWRSHQSYMYAAGASELTRETTDASVQGKSLGDGRIQFTDPTGGWGMSREAVSVSTKKVRENGDEEQQVKVTKLNSFLGNNLVIVAQDLDYSAMVSTKEEFLGSFPKVVSDFVRQFAALHQDAVRAHKDLDACVASITPAQAALCDQLQEKYNTADKARHEYWETLPADQLYEMVPTEASPQ
ncbi:MAG: hypothetical protein HY078_13850 [Elusimicrobia bacterium]|nr:hypothetical protein [Elusimicrobiota bacterium]